MGRFRRDARGASAVEFALVCAPFFVLVLYTLQLGIYYMTQTALDAGVIRTADDLRNSFNYAATPVFPTADALKATVAANAGGLITATDSSLTVEIRPMATFSGTVVPITGGVADYGDGRSVLVLRAQSSVIALAPGFSNLTKVTAISLLRRQGR